MKTFVRILQVPKIHQPIDVIDLAKTRHHLILVVASLQELP